MRKNLDKKPTYNLIKMYYETKSDEEVNYIRKLLIERAPNKNLNELLDRYSKYINASDDNQVISEKTWVRKISSELAHERNNRRIKFLIYFFVPIFLILILIYLNIGSIDNLLEINNYGPEGIIVFVLLPVFTYFAYRNYVLHGKFTERPGKICLGCEIGLGFSDDGWGFKSYGKHKKEWYQIKACKAPEKCDIAYLHEVKWVNTNNNDQTSKPKKNQLIKDYISSNKKRQFIVACIMILLVYGIIERWHYFSVLESKIATIKEIRYEHKSCNGASSCKNSRNGVCTFI